MVRKKLLLIDGSSMMKGAFYGLPAGGAGGIRNLIVKFLEAGEVDYLAAVFCCKLPGNGNVGEALLKQQEALEKMLAAMNIPVLNKEGWSSPDIIATLVKEGQGEDLETMILSEDRKLLQAVNESVKLKIPVTGELGLEFKVYSLDSIREEYGLEPGALGEVLSLSGNWGIGEKTACRLIERYQSIENLYNHLEEVESQRIREILSAHREEIERKEKEMALKEDCNIRLDYTKAMTKNQLIKGSFLENSNGEAANGGIDDSGFLKCEDGDSIFSDGETKDGGAEDRGTENGFSALNPPQEPFGEANTPLPLWAVKEKFSVISDFSEAETIFSRCGKDSRLGLQLIIEDKAVSALALALSETECYCITAQGFLTPDYLSSKAGEICGRSSHVTVIHLKEQLAFLNITPESQVFDAGVAAYLLNPLKDSYEYQDLANDHLGLSLPSKAELIGKHSLKKALEENEEKAVSCVCYMAYVAWSCGDKLRTDLKSTGMDKLFFEIEMPLIYSLFSMESAGIQVEKERLKEYGDRLKVGIAEVEQKIYQETGETFNINSPKQLGEVLFDHMKLPGGKKTKSGYSTAADILEKLASDYPVVGMILDYRQLTKLNSTYADGLAAYIGPDQRIHGTFNQTITATGRISSTEPNLQNIPVRVELGREIRKVFVPKEGCVFVDADYSQIELRVLAHMSGDQRLINAYRQAEDIHAITASQVFHVPLDQVTSLQRRNAKAVNFGIVYGISSFGLSEGLSITRKEASEYISKYFETYPEVKSFLDGLVTEAKEQGYAVSMFGRRRPIPELKSSNFMQRSFGERVAMNSPIQGTAADIIKIAMVRVDKALKKQGLKSRIVLQVHDELLIEAYKEELDQVKMLLVEEMKHAAVLEVPLEVDANVGNSWFDAK